MNAVTVDRVTKRFGDVVAVDDLSLSVEEGEIFGFLGPNGAGKSTTINMLLDFVKPTAGEISVLGMDAQTDSKAIRQRIGVLPEGYQTYDRLTGRQHLEFAIESKDTEDDPDALLERVGLDPDDADRKAGGYSKGMSQRLLLAMALVGEPDLLIFDEPSTGLDPHGVRLMRDIVREERDRGATVFFSSHILEQVEAVADRVAILNEGRLLTVDTIDGLREAVGADAELTIMLADGPTGETTTDDGESTTGPGQATVADPAGIVESIDGVTSVDRRGDELVVVCRREAKLPVLDRLRERGATIRDFTTDETSLEDLFVSFTEGDR